MSDDDWEYGFFDSDAPGYVWWSTFGGLVRFDSPESARHTANKCVTGEAVIVRRLPGDPWWEKAP